MLGRQPGRDPGGELPGLVEPAIHPQRDVLPGVLGAVQLCEDALRMVRVVEEQKHVAEADQHVRAVAGGGERVRGAMHIADYVNPHEINIDSGGRRRRSRARVQHARPGGGPCIGEPGRRCRAPRGRAAPGCHAAPQGRRRRLAGRYRRAVQGRGARARPRADRGRRRGRRPGGDHVAHALRVDAARLRALERRRGRRADLRDLLGRPGRVDPVRLGRPRRHRRDRGASSR